MLSDYHWNLLHFAIWDEFNFLQSIEVIYLNYFTFNLKSTFKMFSFSRTIESNTHSSATRESNTRNKKKKKVITLDEFIFMAFDWIPVQVREQSVPWGKPIKIELILFFHINEVKNYIVSYIFPLLQIFVIHNVDWNILSNKSANIKVTLKLINTSLIHFLH